RLRRGATLAAAVLCGAARDRVPRRAFRGERAGRSVGGLARSSGRRCRMRRTFALFAIALASLAAAAVAVLLRPAVPKPPPPPAPRAASAAAGMRMAALLDRLYLPEDQDGTAYLQIDLAADAAPVGDERVPVNAVLIL